MFGTSAFGENGEGEFATAWLGTQPQVSFSGAGASLSGFQGFAEINSTIAGVLFGGAGFAGSFGVGPFQSLAAQAGMQIGMTSSLHAAVERTVVTSVFGVPGFGVVAYGMTPPSGIGGSFLGAPIVHLSTQATLRAKSAFQTDTALHVGARAALATLSLFGTDTEISVSAYGRLIGPALLAAKGGLTIVPAASLSTALAPLIKYARSNFCRARGTRSDYYGTALVVSIGGTDRGNAVWKDTLRIESVLNEQVDTASMTVSGFDPLPGQVIIVGSGALSNRVFAGTIQRVSQRSVNNWVRKIYDVDCTDWTWTLNKRRAFITYDAGTSISIAAADLVARYAPTFSTARIQSGGPPLAGAIDFRGTPIVDALTQLAQVAAPVWHTYPDFNQVVHFFDVEIAQEQEPRPLAVGNLNYDSLNYQLDLTQIQTRVIAVGGGGQTTQPVDANATQVPVNECGWYNPTGGYALNGATIFHYTTMSVLSGVGWLTGVTGFTRSALIDTTMNVFVQVDDLAGQHALALLLGGGDDGIREGFVTDGRWSRQTCLDQATALLNTYKDLNVSGTYHTYDKLTKVGQRVMIALPARSLNHPVVLQKVSRSLASPTLWEFTAQFAIIWRDLVDMLSQALQPSTMG